MVAEADDAPVEEGCLTAQEVVTDVEEQNAFKSSGLYK